MIPTLSSADFTPLLPAFVLSVGAMVLLISEVFLSPTSSRAYQAILTVALSVLAGFLALGQVMEPGHFALMRFIAADPFSSFLSVIICVGLGLAALLGAPFLRQRQAERGEFYALMCFAAAGMMLLSISAELITLFINLELLSVATYALTAYLRRGPRPSEAAFKYFILGAFSSALFIYGAALLYGATGTTHLLGISGALPEAFRQNPALVYCGMGLVAAGFAFKVAAVPFHMWTPDVYEGAPTPITALMSVGVKAAAFAALIRVFVMFARNINAHLPLVLFSTLAVLTMVGGNLLALPQRSVKRMLAYSSIAHAGYVLVGVAALFAQIPVGSPVPGLHILHETNLGGSPSSDLLGRSEILRSVLFYLLAYTVTAVGAFGTLSAIERREDEDKPFAWDLDRLSGLVSRRPGWATAMAIFMLSLGGIPPTIGFMGKFLVFRAAVDSGLTGLALVGVLTSAVGIYYYLRVVVYMFMRAPQEGMVAPERQWPTEVALWLSTAAVVFLGLLPGSISTWLGRAGSLWMGP